MGQRPSSCADFSGAGQIAEMGVTGAEEAGNRHRQEKRMYQYDGVFCRESKIIGWMKMKKVLVLAQAIIQRSQDFG